ncbi:hypothetical protein PoB_004744100 [Plakobranchus ocellatus]|uniref:Uncharacterized protein n=1 Tax=Plakobranchus ocellatus TaxID=259542 RepID=A0AAV4BC43_9GAST|nr:hypothetical protein PoB_004744100 [Plakobranchus ocellatus]
MTIGLSNITKCNREMFAGINGLVFVKKHTPWSSKMKNKKNSTPLTETENIGNSWKAYCTEMYNSDHRNLQPMEPNGDTHEPLRSGMEWAIN